MKKQVFKGAATALITPMNEDGSVTANGTATAQITFDLIPRESAMLTDLIGEELILSGCPISGGQDIYQLQVFTPNFSAGATDRGSGLKFTLTNSIAYAYITIFSGVTVDNVTFYPMIRKASVKNDRYMPYGKGSVEVKSCGKNKLKNTATSKTVNGVEFVVNEDKSITLNGTASASIGNYYLNQENMNLDNMIATCEGIDDLSGIYFAINKNATEEQQKASLDFLDWLFSSETGKKYVTEKLGFIRVC